MALTTFYGWTEAELLTALRKAQDDLIKGATILSAGTGDVNQSREIQASARERIAEIQLALYQIDPDTYVDFATVGASQTQAVFSVSSSS